VDINRVERQHAVWSLLHISLAGILLAAWSHIHISPAETLPAVWSQRHISHAETLLAVLNPLHITHAERQHAALHQQHISLVKVRPADITHAGHRHVDAKHIMRIKVFAEVLLVLQKDVLLPDAQHIIPVRLRHAVQKHVGRPPAELNLLHINPAPIRPAE